MYRTYYTEWRARFEHGRHANQVRPRQHSFMHPAFDSVHDAVGRGPGFLCTGCAEETLPTAGLEARICLVPFPFHPGLGHWEPRTSGFARSAAYFVIAGTDTSTEGPYTAVKTTAVARGRSWLGGGGQREER